MGFAEIGYSIGNITGSLGKAGGAVESAAGSAAAVAHAITAPIIPSVGGIFEPAVAFGNSISSFGPKLEVPFFPFIKEGPAPANILTDMSYAKIDNLNPIGANRFNPWFDFGMTEPVFQPEFSSQGLLDIKEPGLMASDAVLEAESILFQAKANTKREAVLDQGLKESEPEYLLDLPQTITKDYLIPISISKPAEVVGEITSQPQFYQRHESEVRNSLLTRSLLMLTAARVAAHTIFPIPLETGSDPEVAQAFLTKTEPKVAAQTNTAVKTDLNSTVGNEPNALYISPQTEIYTKTTQPDEVEEIEEENVEEGHEGEKESKLTHRVDRNAVKKRVDKIQEAGLHALGEAKSDPVGAEGKVEISGWRIVKRLLTFSRLHFRGQDIEETDPKGTLPDGTWEANMEKIGKETFSSQSDMANRTRKIIALDNPVAKGEGEEVKDENMHTTYKYDKTKIHPLRQVVRKIIRLQRKTKIIKKGQQPIRVIPMEEKITERSERTIHQLDPDLALALKAA